MTVLLTEAHLQQEADIRLFDCQRDRALLVVVRDELHLASPPSLQLSYKCFGLGTSGNRPDIYAKGPKAFLLPYLDRRQPAFWRFQLYQINPAARKKDDTVGHSIISGACKFERSASQILNLLSQPFFNFSLSHFAPCDSVTKATFFPIRAYIRLRGRSSRVLW